MSERKMQVKKQDITKANEAYDEGMKLLLARELEKAAECFKASLALDAGCDVARYQLGAVLAMQGKYDGALNRFEELVQARGEYAFLSQIEQGYVLYLAGRHEEAVQRLDVYLKTCDDPWAWLFKSLAFESLGKTDDAKQSFKKSVAAARRESDGEGPCYWWLMEADDMSGIGWLERALICNEVLIKLDPQYYSAMEEKGCLLRGLGLLEEALVWFDKALEAGQDDDGYWCTLYNKGLCLAALARHQEAVVLYDRVIANDDNDFDVVSDAEKARDSSLKAIAKLSQ
jgi:tetratricopeptide (TPR) repeat protein